MTRKKHFVIPLMVLALAALAALACSAAGGGGGITDPTEVPSLFKDDFSSSSSGWSTFTSDTGSVEYVDGEYVMGIFTNEWFIWGNPEESFGNVHVEVTARNTGGATDTSFGIICNYQDETQQYYLAIDTQGFYAIAKTIPDQADFFLTNDDDWGTSDDITKDASSYRLGADCDNGVITLYVDGIQIASASDTDYGQGDVGLFAWTADESNGEIRFDDFVVTALP